MRNSSESFAREAAERRYEALHDPLTELGNRSLLAERTDAALADRRDAELIAILLMDLNRFKDVNDTLGHHHGDALLREVGVTTARLGAGQMRRSPVSAATNSPFSSRI